MICSNCKNEAELIYIENTPWVYSEAWYCVTCINNMLANWQIAYFKWKYYSWLHPDIVFCEWCSRKIHKNFAHTSNWYCLKCLLRYPDNWCFCVKCWTRHRDGICNASLSDNIPVVNGRLNFVVRNDNKSWNPRGEAVDNVSYIKKIWQFQIERETPVDVAEMLRKFYHWWKTFQHYYTWEPIHIEGTVKYNNMQVICNLGKKLQRLRQWIEMREEINWWYKLSRFHNYYVQWIDDSWLVKRKYIDLMWNVRERSESINKFYDDIWINKTNEQMSWEFTYVLSSNLEHKVKAFTLNETVHSCQKSNNSDSYARWAYDAITNGCNCPILLYNKWNKKPFARITTRIMYDNDGQEYILIDRLYHSWQFQDWAMKGEVYKSIVTDLKAKWYKVIASNYSAHDQSTYAYLASLWMKSETVITDLCQPLRRLVNRCWYYCDGWTVVRDWDIDWLTRATDYLDKAYLL